MHTITITGSAQSFQVFYLHTTRTVGTRTETMGAGGMFTNQSAAEHYADGLAAGLRVCGHAVEIVIDIQDEPVGPAEGHGEPTISEDDADLLDFASFDAWAQDRAVARAETPEADPVAVRLARDAEAGHYRAKALGL